MQLRSVVTHITVNANVTLSATFESTSTPPVTPDSDPVPDPSPTVYYTVTLPVVEGATTDPVGNEVVATDAVKVWAAKGNLHISTVTGQTARVYNLAGSLVKQAEIPAGDTLWPLPSGIYIVQRADTRYKVIL